MKKFLELGFITLLFLSSACPSSFIDVTQLKGGGTGTFFLTSVNGVNAWGNGPTIAPTWELNIVPTGTPNGTLTTFTLPTTPTNAASIQLFRNGLLQQQATSGDYTFSGTTITFNSSSIPQTGDILIAFYF